MCGTWWGAPGYRVSHELATRKRVTNWTWCKHEQLKHRKHSFTDVVSGLYLRSVQRIRFSFVEGSRGSSHSRALREVVVHATVVEVVVLTRSRVDGRGTRDLGGGRRSRSFQRGT